MKKLQFELSTYCQERDLVGDKQYIYTFNCIGSSISDVTYTAFNKPLSFRTSKVFSMTELEELFNTKVI